MKLILLFVVVFISGCGQTEKQIKQAQMHEQAWKACINSGGIPIGSWFNEVVISNCIYNPKR